MYNWKANFLSFQMIPIFSNISYFMCTKFSFFEPTIKIVAGDFKTPKKLKNFRGKFLYYCLKFCQMMPQKSSFHYVFMIKGLVSW